MGTKVNREDPREKLLHKTARDAVKAMQRVVTQAGISDAEGLAVLTSINQALTESIKTALKAYANAAPPA